MSFARAAPLRILHVEDVPADAELAERELVKAGIAYEIRRVETREAFLAALSDYAPELILSDYRLPAFDGMQALLLAKEHSPDLPVIITTGSVNEETAVACMRAGAADYVLKDHLGRLGTAIRSALEKQRLAGDRRRTMEALRQSEERFKSLFENALLGLYRTTPDGSVLMANPCLCRMLGYDSFEELKARNLEEEGFEPSYPRSEFRRKLEEEGVVLGQESSWRRRDGSFVFVRESATAIRDGSGKVLHYEGTVEDITERKQAEEALRASQKALRTLIDSSPDAVTLLEPGGTVIACNRLVAQQFGKGIQEIVGRSAFAFGPADVAEERRKRVAEVSVTNRVIRHHEEILGRIQDVILVPIDDEDGRVTQVAVFVHDVTDLERARADLAKSELYYKSLIENAIDITAMLGPGGEIRYVSPSVERVLGYAPGEVLGFSVFHFVHPEDRPEMESRLGRVQEDGTRIEMVEGRFRHRDGTWRTLSVIGKLLPPETGMQGQIVNARDITERIQLEAQLRQALKMEAVGRLAGGVAHDFNNLLTVIQGYGELLSMSLADDPERRESVGEIVKAAERAAALTRQLLAFSRRQVLEVRVLDLGTIVADTEKMLRRLIGEDIEVVVVKPAALGRVKADPGQIEQVLLNLAVNSRDAMPGGGRMTLELSDLDLDAPLTTAHDSVPAGRYVVVSVSDTGIGMDAETFDHLFEPFFTTKEKGKGTGLGLATIFGIVKQSGGYVAVASAPGAGTTFRIFFPRAEEAAASNPVAIVAPARGTETVLLVEDEPSVRSLTRQLLEARGYRVLAADGSVSAIELAERHEGPIHLLLTDLVMPGLNGRRLAEAVTTRRPGIPVLFISGYSSDVLSREGLRRSSARFLQKPFTEASLARAVREALDKPQ